MSSFWSSTQRRVAILHSGLTAAQRHQQWSLVADGQADIVIGARSAVFAPVPDGRLGLIIVDEEHDGSYKQDQAPRYHGRDVALKRAQLAACPIVLGSATPSFESWHNATARGLYELHELKERVPVPWDEDGGGIVSGRDFVVNTIAENVTRLRFERVPTSVGQPELVDITLELTTPAAGTVSLNTRVRVGGAL